ncbi:unnamed protein product [Brassicogethes aeneus]|uniref:Uncharacterized protein n=1 Tax=Brassicogethes aeneus TaxID=1431903 RepID=A0A9P0BFJ6_BRAAE|nr:unnamed protein product [Brassicogethes aeneus]
MPFPLIKIRKFNEKLKDLKTSKALVSSSLWKEIAQVIRVYVEQTDLRRMHFVELKCLDKESLEEIGKNQELIGIEESEIDRLNLRYEQLYTTKEGKIKILSSELEDLNHAYLKLRQKLKTDLALDKSQLMLCTSLGEETIAKVKEDRILGEQLMVLVKACQKFETEKERILKWAPMIKINLKEFGDLTLVKGKIRPKTSASKPTKIISLDIRKPEPQAPMVEKLDENNLKSCFDNLQSLENFWQTYNKVNIDFLESKQESKMLQNENKELRGMIRAILETALLNNSIPNTRASTRAPSRMRSAFSAPQRRILFK